MSKLTSIQNWFFVFLTLISLQLFPQINVQNRIVIERFSPINESSRNEVLDNDLPSLIKLGFLGMQNNIYINRDILSKTDQKNNKGEQLSPQQIYIETRLMYQNDPQ